MTRIKVVSVLAVGLLLTALGASSASAWAGVSIWVTVSCNTGKVVVHGTDNESKDLANAKPSTLTFTDSTGAEVETVDFKVSDKSDVIAKVETSDFTDFTGPFKAHLDADKSVKSNSFSVDCEHASPSPTATATATPNATTSPSATATAQPSASATASAAPASTAAVPAPPVTGQGPGGGGNNFGIVLLVMVLGTVVIGGTTLALSRKGK